MRLIDITLITGFVLLSCSLTAQSVPESTSNPWCCPYCLWDCEYSISQPENVEDDGVNRYLCAGNLTVSSEVSVDNVKAEKLTVFDFNADKFLASKLSVTIWAAMDSLKADTTNWNSMLQTNSEDLTNLIDADAHYYGTKISDDGLASAIAARGAPNGIVFSVANGTESPFNQNYTDVMTMQFPGNVGIGTTTPEFPLDVAGTFFADTVVIGAPYLVEGTVATIDGRVQISPVNSIPKPFDIAEYGDDFLLWIEQGIVTDDIVVADPDEWSDHVFDEEYTLLDLDSVKSFIEHNEHLPNVPSETEILESGYSLNKMNATLLEKIEELTLYTIYQRQRLNELKTVEDRIEALENQLLHMSQTSTTK